MSDTVQHRTAWTNETFRCVVRFVDDETGEPFTVTDARMRGYVRVAGQEIEVFDVVPTQDQEGWVTGFVPSETMALATPGVGAYDMVLEFENDDRQRVVGGTLQVKQGASQW